MADNDADTISFEFRYSEKVDGFEDDGTEKDAVLEPLFKELVVPEFLNNDELAALQVCEVIVEGHAIQAVGFEPEDTTGMTEEEIFATAEDAAWAGFDKQAELEK